MNSMPVSNNFNTESVTNFDWSNVEESQDEWPWPEDASEPQGLGEHLVHSDWWIHGFMSNTFTEQLQKVLTNCQPYPGDDELEPYLVSSCFLVLPMEEEYLPSVIMKDVLTLISTCPVFARIAFPLASGMLSSVLNNAGTHISGKQPTFG